MGTEVIGRVAIAYLFVLVGFRIIGKRDLGSLSPFDLVVLMLIPEIFSPSLTGGDDSLRTAVVGGATIFVLLYLSSLLSHRSKVANKMMEGKPTVLMKNGQILSKALDSQRITKDEIRAEARKVGIFDLADVSWAILETDGEISIIPKNQRSPTFPSSSSASPVG